jgi:hypothetical protein
MYLYIQRMEGISIDENMEEFDEEPPLGGNVPPLGMVVVFLAGMRCPVCPEMTTYKHRGGIAKHWASRHRRHLPNRNCPVCSLTFVKLHDLTRHYRRIHLQGVNAEKAVEVCRQVPTYLVRNRNFINPGTRTFPDGNTPGPAATRPAHRVPAATVTTATVTTVPALTSAEDHQREPGLWEVACQGLKLKFERSVTM